METPEQQDFNWILFTDRQKPVVDTPLVTLQQHNGTFGLNRAAYVALGEPERVELLFDAARQAIGIRATDADVTWSYPARRQLKNNTPSNTWAVAGGAFCKRFGIDHSKTRRFVAEMHNDVLVIDLAKHAAPKVRRVTNGQSPE